MKKVYVIRSNHDGTLGVFTNKTLAFAKVLDYLGEEPMSLYEGKRVTYAKFCKEVKDYDYCSVDFCSADEETLVYVEQCVLNR